MKPGPPPRKIPPWGEGISTHIIGTLVGVLLAALVAGIGIAACGKTIRALEAEGTKAVVLDKKTHSPGKRTYDYVDLEAEDGTRWTARADDELLAGLKPGDRTTIYRTDGEFDQDAAFPKAYAEPQRAHELSEARRDQKIALFGFCPFFGLLTLYAFFKDRHRHRVWSHGVALEGEIVGVAKGMASYRFTRPDGTIVNGRADHNERVFRDMGGPPVPRMKAWILYEPHNPERHVLYGLERDEEG